MPQDKSQGRRLLIISDSPMWRDGDGVKVFEATLRDVEQLTSEFASITWIGFLWPGEAKGNARRDKTGKIKLIPMPFAGGSGWFNKAKIAIQLPRYVAAILRELPKADVVHNRAPSVPALIGTLLSFIDKKHVYWHKYAGNWIQPDANWFTKLQIRLLKNVRNSKVTINGNYVGQRTHVLSFANPCFTDTEMKEATGIREAKNYEGPLSIVFAGRLETLKGVGRLLEAVKLIEGKADIANLFLVGDGPERPKWEEMASDLKTKTHFLGYIGREELNKVYSQGHIFCLPSSAAEGFPKVIAEAAAFGCVPVVSSISSIAQFVKHDESGVVLKDLKPETIAGALLKLFNDRSYLKKLSDGSDGLVEPFTYTKYNQRIMNEVLAR